MKARYRDSLREEKLVPAGPVRRLLSVVLVQTDTVDQIGETGIAAQGIKIRMHLEKLQNVRLFLECLLHPEKCLISFVETHICVHKCPGGNILFVSASV